MHLHKVGGFTIALAGLVAQSAFSQAWTTAYSSSTATGDCGGLPASLNTGFKVDPVVTRAQFGTVAPARIIKMAFYKQPSAQNTDIYIAEKGAAGANARILYYNGANSTLSVIGTMTNVNYGGGGVEEQGLVGIGLNPNTFATDNFLYLFYCTGSGNAGSATVGFNLSRVTLDPTTKQIDFGTEKVLIHIPAATTGRWHTAGGIQFDNAGNLYVSVGDNEALAMGPANTADLRGGILRIHPDASNPKGYTIPAGNFGEYWANQFRNQGKTALADRYLDTSKVKPEIYIKGTRNVYSYSVDATRPGWVEYSQCGPDVQRGETHALTTKPVFGGWPFWTYSGGSVVRQQSKASAYDESGEPSTSDWNTFNPTSMNTNTPVNNWSGSKGVDTLPPYNLPFYGVGPGCAAGGPIVRYNGALSNPGQMPPHLDNTIMFSDFNVGSGNNSVWAIKVDPNTGAVTGNPTQVFTMSRSGRPSLFNSVDFQQGADGALYMADWGAGCCSASPPATLSGIVRISYTGTCKDPGRVTTSLPKSAHNEHVYWFRVKSGRIILDNDVNGLNAKGSHVVKIMDVNGAVLHTFAGNGTASYALPRLSPGRVYVLRAETPAGVYQRPLAPL